MSKDMTTVCSKCFRASCWQGLFMCEQARIAGTVEKSVSDLKRLNLEHKSYFMTNEAIETAVKRAV